MVAQQLPRRLREDKGYVAAAKDDISYFVSLELQRPAKASSHSKRNVGSTAQSCVSNGGGAWINKVTMG